MKQLKSTDSIIDDDESVEKINTRISFYEEGIAEDDKLRGTRQKIDEPDTPYSYARTNSIESSDAPYTLSRSKSVDSCGVPRDIHKGADLAGSVLDILDKEHQEEQTKDDFKKKRRDHYDEFRRIKEMRDKGLLDEEDEDEAGEGVEE